tara:strand:- start:69 stop:674 length:606 start_codon:yes stop_codon:yes gene_type:complete
MPFFSESGPGGFQPKRSFRFLVNFTNLTDMSFMVKTATKPNYTIKGTTHSILNHKFKFPGVVEWADVTIDFIDAVEPNVGSKFYNALLNAGYVEPMGYGDLVTGITKVQSTSALGEVRIKQLDGGGILLPVGVDPGEAIGAVDDTRIVEEWTLKNAWLNKVDFGKLDYSSEDLLSISATITYDYAHFDHFAGAGKVYKSGT